MKGLATLEVKFEKKNENGNLRNREISEMQNINITLLGDAKHQHIIRKVSVFVRKCIIRKCIFRKGVTSV